MEESEFFFFLLQIYCKGSYLQTFRDESVIYSLKYYNVICIFSYVFGIYQSKFHHDVLGYKIK